jgi:hypothetical protein
MLSLALQKFAGGGAHGRANRCAHAGNWNRAAKRAPDKWKCLAGQSLQYIPEGPGILSEELRGSTADCPDDVLKETIQKVVHLRFTAHPKQFRGERFLLLFSEGRSRFCFPRVTFGLAFHLAGLFMLIFRAEFQSRAVNVVHKKFQFCSKKFNPLRFTRRAE